MQRLTSVTDGAGFSERGEKSYLPQWVSNKQNHNNKTQQLYKNKQT